MPTKLKDLRITKVDFVDAGANPAANIVLYKNKAGAPATVPPEEGGEKQKSALKKFFSAIAKAVGITDKELDEAVESIEKGDKAVTFDEKLAQANLRKTMDEIWDYCYFLQESLCSIIRDDEVPQENKGTLMSESLNEFTEALKNAIPKWAAGMPVKVAKTEQIIPENRLEFAKATQERLAQMIAKAEQPPHTTDPAPDENNGHQTSTKGEAEMNIDKSKLSPEELAALEAIEKKAGIPEGTQTQKGETATAPESESAPTTKSTTAPASKPAEGEGEDIYKGLHPAVKTELERLRKQADTVEERELTEIAKKYELIGKKPEELVPTLKILKSAGGNAYDQMIAVLDASLAAVEKSGLFNEVGKRGGGESDAWAAIEKHAETIQKAAPTMTWNQAIEKACEQHPELVKEYEEKR